MALVARSVLCIPAASAMSENNFSDAGITVTKKRNSLKPRVVNDLLFLRSNRDITNLPNKNLLLNDYGYNETFYWYGWASLLRLDVVGRHGRAQPVHGRVGG
jgi:hypothetical protein